jgi:hypothetical protein
MKSRLFKIITGILGCVALILLMGYFAMQRHEGVQALPPTVKLKIFQGQNPPFNFVFEYPEAWRVKERGYKGDYDMVEVMSVSDKDTLVIPGVFITKKVLHPNDTAESLMKAWLRDESHYKNFKASSSKRTEVAGQKGVKVEYGYRLPLPLWTSGAQDVPLQKVQIIFIRGDAAFQITFMGTGEQFKTYKPIFNHILETFKFLD